MKFLIFITFCYLLELTNLYGTLPIQENIAQAKVCQYGEILIIVYSLYRKINLVIFQS